MQTELEFTKVSEGSDSMTAEVVVSNDFNLHLEMVQKGNVVVELSTVEQGKKAIKDVKSVGDNGVFDEDYDVLVVPKYLRIRTTSQVRKGWITMKD